MATQFETLFQASKLLDEAHVILAKQNMAHMCIGKWVAKSVHDELRAAFINDSKRYKALYEKSLWHKIKFAFKLIIHKRIQSDWDVRL